MFNILKRIPRNMGRMCYIKRIYSLSSSRATQQLRYSLSRIAANQSNRNQISDMRKMQQREEFHTTAKLRSEVVVRVPPFAESINEGDVKFTCKVGDSFVIDQIVMEIETDKTAVPIYAPISGYITVILVTDGSAVKPGMELFKMKPGKASEPPAAPPPPAEPAPAAPTTTTTTKVEAPKVATKPKAATSAAIKANEKIGKRETLRVKMTPIRAKVVENVKSTQRTNALLTTMNQIDMNNCLKFREEQRINFEKKHAVKLGLLSIFVRACANALEEQPVVNNVIEGNHIVHRNYIDVAVCIAAKRGVVLPVIRNVQSKKYADIEAALHELKSKAANERLTPEEMSGGTFAIDNSGVYGSLINMPIVNPGQSAMLGMHAIIQRPTLLERMVVVHPMMYVAFTYDHRLIDGREAVLFLRKIKDSIENEKFLAEGLV